MENPLKIFLTKNGLSKTEFAQKHNFHRNTIAWFLDAKRKPNSKTLHRIMEATNYHVFAEDLLKWYGEQQLKKLKEKESSK